MPQSNFYWERSIEAAKRKDKGGALTTLVCPTGKKGLWGQGEDESSDFLLLV